MRGQPRFAACARGEDQQRVARRGVAVDGDAIEGAVGAVGDEALQRRGSDRRVGEDEAQHRRHVRLDHAGALAEAVDHDLDAVDLGGARRELGEGVGGHDRARGGVPGVGLGLAGELAEQVGELAGVERLADDAGRGNEHLAGRAADRRRRRIGRYDDRFHALLAGEGVGIAGVDDERPRFALAQADGAPVDGSRARLGAGQHAGDFGAGRQHGEQQVGAALVADAGLGRGKAHARNLRHVGQRGGRKRRDGAGLPMGGSEVQRAPRKQIGPLGASGPLRLRAGAHVQGTGWSASARGRRGRLFPCEQEQPMTTRRAKPMITMRSFIGRFLHALR